MDMEITRRPASDEIAIELAGFSKRFGSFAAVTDVTLRVARGEVFGYLGPNGAGKTTTIRCLLGLVRPTTGTVRVMGIDVAGDLCRALSHVGYLPGEFSLWPSMTGDDVLRYLGSLHTIAPSRRAELCERFELSSADLARPVRSYSRGMKQKIGIIQAFQHAPDLVVLDEPTEGLDPLMKERFVELVTDLRDAGGTAFLSSHILSEVELATDRVGILKEGHLVRVGPTAGLAGDPVRHCSLKLHHGSATRALAIPGVSALAIAGNRVTFDFRGDMAPLIQHIARLDVEEFLAEPEHLTEAFMDVFEESA